MTDNNSKQQYSMNPPSVITPSMTTTTATTMTLTMPTPPNNSHPIRARHTIKLSNIRHNFNIVSSAANKQRCTVITVVKADGYGHGAIETALHLADYCGADAFAVATLEEGIVLRKAFMESNPNLPSSKVGPHTGMNMGLGGTANNDTKTMPITSLFTPPSSVDTQSQSDASSIATWSTSTTALAQQKQQRQQITMTSKTHKKIRPNFIRIIVLGPPTDIPNDFNLYIHYNIEVMISSTKMARSLMEWVADNDSRKRAEVDQVANERKIELEEEDNMKRNGHGLGHGQVGGQIGQSLVIGGAATLTGLEGAALGKEVRAILNNKVVKDVTISSLQTETSTTTTTASTTTTTAISSLAGLNGDNKEMSTNVSAKQPLNATTATNNVPIPTPFPFKGIEDTAKESRTRELAHAKIQAHLTGEGEDIDDCIVNNNNIINNVDKIGVDSISIHGSGTKAMYSTTAPSSGTIHLAEDHELDDNTLVSTVSSALAKNAIAAGVPIKARKKIRWHALTDSGMGRLGFKSVQDDYDSNTKEAKEEQEEELLFRNNGNSGTVFDVTQIGPNGERKVDRWKEGPHKDIVSLIKAMTHAEIDGAPIEFYGMCTHMAEASSNSTYTNEQMTRFKSLLMRVRQAGIIVPTISTDNSSALLTSNLTHFDPDELLSQPNVDTRGYVRIGGAIYGQRPAFVQLRPVSTLTALVRHVATFEKGETVGYDRAYVAEKNVRIATLSIGFADGYPRELGNGKGKVLIHGETFHIAGNVCMDMLMVDLGSAEDESNDIGALVSIGDTAYLWGPGADDDGDGDGDGEGGVRLQDIANSLKTTQSALTCGLDKVRVQRQYIE